jgi:predicted DNA-binding transcriptional regulator YafY
MNRYEMVSRMYNIHLLIEQEVTGTPDEFAARFRISRRQLYYVLDELKDYGAQFKYSRRRHTFYYIREFEFALKTFVFKAK